MNLQCLIMRGFFSDGFYRQVKQITGAHNKAETNPPSKVKKRRPSTRGMAPSVVSVHRRLFGDTGGLEADPHTHNLLPRTASRASPWFCFGISTPSSPLELLMGKKLCCYLLVLSLWYNFSREIKCLSKQKG